MIALWTKGERQKKERAENLMSLSEAFRLKMDLIFMSWYLYRVLLFSRVTSDELKALSFNFFCYPSCQTMSKRNRLISVADEAVMSMWRLIKNTSKEQSFLWASWMQHLLIEKTFHKSPDVKKTWNLRLVIHEPKEILNLIHIACYLGNCW